MKLKTATLIALIGVSIRFIWTILMALRNLSIGGAPMLHWISLVPALLFEGGLIVFFATLLHRQGAAGNVE